MPYIAIPSAIPTNINVLPSIDESSETAPTADEPTEPTAKPVPIVARPVLKAAAKYLKPSPSETPAVAATSVTVSAKHYHQIMLK